MQSCVPLVRTRPVKVVCIVVSRGCIIWALTYLEGNRILIVAGNERDTCTELEAVYIVPELRAEVDVNRSAVVLKATNHHNLFTCRDCEVLDRLVGEVEPVHIVHKIACRVHLVKALTPRVGKVWKDLTIEAEIYVTRLKARSSIVLLACEGLVEIVETRLDTNTEDVVLVAKAII